MIYEHSASGQPLRFRIIERPIARACSRSAATFPSHASFSPIARGYFRGRTIPSPGGRRTPARFLTSITFRPPKRLDGQAAFSIHYEHHHRSQDFSAVIHACSEPAPGRESTWISPRFVEAYIGLHRQGYAHSVEVWDGPKLVGGIYGVAIEGFFAGESMFHRATDASKIALCHLMEHLRQRGFRLFDTQVLSPLTARLGAIEIRRREYLVRLAAALHTPVRF